MDISGIVSMNFGQMLINGIASGLMGSGKSNAVPEKLGTWQDDDNKTYHFLKGYALGKKFNNMHKSLILARQFHSGQMRKGGAEYIVHPLRVCDYLISLNLEDDILLSASLLHDAVEDNVVLSEQPTILTTKYNLDQEVLNVVLTLTKKKGMSKEQTQRYYEGIQENWRALLIKLSDRVNNISTMQSFTAEKRMEYIEETKDFVLPLCSYGKLYYPELSNAITAIKYHITSICDTIIYITNQQNGESGKKK